MRTIQPTFTSTFNHTIFLSAMICTPLMAMSGVFPLQDWLHWDRYAHFNAHLLTRTRATMVLLQWELTNSVISKSEFNQNSLKFLVVVNKIINGSASHVNLIHCKYINTNLSKLRQKWPTLIGLGNLYIQIYFILFFKTH